MFAAVGLPWIPPELREDRGEIDAAREGRLPTLVTRADLKGDLHVHTDWSDGGAPLAAMVAAARNAGLAYVGIADHSKFLGATHGLDAAALARQAEAIDALAVRGITVLKGVEVDILEDGTLALPDEVLARLDYVIGAVHTGFQLPGRRQTERLLKALDHPHLTILAHPRGRLINERPPMEFDLAAVLDRARSRGAFVELNCQPSRLDLPDVDCALARERGVRVAVGSDAHREDGFAALEPGLLEARRGGLTAADVLNTLPLAKLRAAIRARAEPCRRPGGAAQDATASVAPEQRSGRSQVRGEQSGRTGRAAAESRGDVAEQVRRLLRKGGPRDEVTRPEAAFLVQSTPELAPRVLLRH